MISDPKLSDTITLLLEQQNISEERKIVIQPLVDFIQEKTFKKLPVNINFICTHNSRRSHLSQVWAQVAAAHFQIQNVVCYSGGTEVTALFPKVVETFQDQGFSVIQISNEANPVYAIKFGQNSSPIIAFSKKYDHPFNPSSTFAAVLTCSQADNGCPYIAGAEKRIPITFEDPKISDNTPQQKEIYSAISLQIASEMFYVFSQIKK